MNNKEKNKVKVYVAVGGMAYMGYYPPLGVYSTRRKAEKSIKEDKAGYRYADFYDVFEYEIDETEEFHPGEKR